VPTALIVGGGTETARRAAFEFNPAQMSVERKIEIQPRLLSIGNDVQPSGGLIVYGGQDRIVLQFGSICFPELIQM
jgi:hypothetical protein